jgi:hypothetical protein
MAGFGTTGAIALATRPAQRRLTTVVGRQGEDE